MTEQHKTSADAKRDVIAAKNRLADLRKEYKRVVLDLREANKAAARQRAEAARGGESAAGVAADLDVQGLRSRKDELPFEIWAAELAVEELKIEQYNAESHEAIARHEEARRVLEEIEPEFLEMKAKYERAVADVHNGPHDLHRSNLLRVAKQRIADLEENYPGHDDQDGEEISFVPRRARVRVAG
jgi:predicted  nucleic acid-binding Zn-ribbon protein